MSKRAWLFTSIILMSAAWCRAEGGGKKPASAPIASTTTAAVDDAAAGSIEVDLVPEKPGVPSNDWRGGRVLFRGRDGKSAREVKLDRRQRRGRFKDKRLGVEVDSEVVTHRGVKVSEDGRWAAVAEVTTETPLDPVVDAAGGSTVVEVLDRSGKLRYRTPVVEGWELDASFYKSVVFGEDGSVALMLYDATERKGEGRAADYQLRIFDRTGREAAVYPDKPSSISFHFYCFSPNGKYFAATARRGTVFFNLQNGKVWEADKKYVVYEIKNDGIAESDYYDREQKKRSGLIYLDLKKNLD